MSVFLETTIQTFFNDGLKQRGIPTMYSYAHYEKISQAFIVFMGAKQCSSMWARYGHSSNKNLVIICASLKFM